MQDISLNAYKLYVFNNATYIQQINDGDENKHLGTITVENSPYTEQSLGELLVDAILLSILTAIGLIANTGSILIILRKNPMRHITNIFYLHHCLINFAECVLFIPFIVSVVFQFEITKGCNILSGGCCILITANILNIVNRKILTFFFSNVEELINFFLCF